MGMKDELESILFLGGDENKIKDLAKFFSVSLEDMLKILEELKEDRKDSGICVEINADLVYLVTNPKNGEVIHQYFEQEVKPRKLSAAAMETLSIIAYRQPITKREIEKIRGVGVDRIVQTLEERNLVRVCGHRDSIGRPKLYEVSNKFLGYMGISSLEELPEYEKIKESFDGRKQNSNQ
ncbi:segregation and condensation protein B [Fusobacterium necrophorum]|uniref:Chromosome segregation protein ScpB n=1 Tax=Fusobacterium necrophorum BL TaxID=1441732 RepID=A0AB73BUX9_9FUSO|nr:SMC-Scp complex subunit ScpB [Fusobacterium necrophorum]KDE62258.1 chromosome segregation protein ScpB [Fusobacterium necrophorum BL]KDE66685.1 chromosome segregation protein ScpB [Fusobacterium necrophorum BFTR-1]KDE73840.1 chromosome segregation protein ScpB [Fusobacterium necrophorum BFTR-2]MBR8821960.1 Segregation and condensation protein B [Fusobacterium necrophorum]MCF0161593.1 SMC-Scp complex subunit ScpB [Fusobacterium necrophorum]